MRRRRHDAAETRARPPSSRACSRRSPIRSTSIKARSAIWISSVPSPRGGRHHRHADRRRADTNARRRNVVLSLRRSPSANRLAWRRPTTYRSAIVAAPMRVRPLGRRRGGDERQRACRSRRTRAPCSAIRRSRRTGVRTLLRHHYHDSQRSRRMRPVGGDRIAARRSLARGAIRPLSRLGRCARRDHSARRAQRRSAQAPISANGAGENRTDGGIGNAPALRGAAPGGPDL